MELKTKHAFKMLTKAGTGERERRLKAAIKWWLVIKCRQNRIHTSAIHTRNTQIREICEYNAYKKNITSICTSHTQIQYKHICTVYTPGVSKNCYGLQVWTMGFREGSLCQPLKCIVLIIECCGEFYQYFTIWNEHLARFSC